MTRLLPTAAESVRASLGKLFDPVEVRLVEMSVGPASDTTPGSAIHVGFRIGNFVGARLVIAATDPDAARIGDVLLHRAHTGPVPDERAREALTELANIAASSFLSRLAAVSRLRLIPSIPEVLGVAALADSDAALIAFSISARYEVVLAAGTASFVLTATPERRLMEALRTATVSSRTA